MVLTSSPDLHQLVVYPEMYIPEGNSKEID